jgi:hypothetical protein
MAHEAHPAPARRDCADDGIGGRRSGAKVEDVAPCDIDHTIGVAVFVCRRRLAQPWQARQPSQPNLGQQQRQGPHCPPCRWGDKEHDAPAKPLRSHRAYCAGAGGGSKGSRRQGAGKGMNSPFLWRAGCAAQERRVSSFRRRNRQTGDPCADPNRARSATGSRRPASVHRAGWQPPAQGRCAHPRPWR